MHHVTRQAKDVHFDTLQEEDGLQYSTELLPTRQARGQSTFDRLVKFSWSASSGSLRCEARYGGRTYNKLRMQHVVPTASHKESNRLITVLRRVIAIYRTVLQTSTRGP